MDRRHAHADSHLDYGSDRGDTDTALTAELDQLYDTPDHWSNLALTAHAAAPADPEHDVRQRRAQQRAKSRAMVNRHTVIDVKKIRAETAQRGTAASNLSAATVMSLLSRQQSELAAEWLMQAMQHRGVAHRQQRFAETVKSGKHARFSVEEKQQRESSECDSSDEDERARLESTTSARSLVGDSQTFLTGTDDTGESPLPPLSSPSPASRRDSETVTHDSAESKEQLAPPLPPTESHSLPLSPSQTRSSVSSMAIYERFVHSRVRHMLIANRVFVDQPDHRDAYVAQARDRYEVTQASSLPFHLPSLQAEDPHQYKPSSAAIELASHDEQALYALILFLSRIPLFAAMPLSAFLTMAPLLHLQSFDDMEVLAAEGEPGDYLYFVYKGRVDVKLNINATANELEFMDTGTAERPPRDLIALAQRAEIVPPGPPAQKRRFHSINTASLDIACLGPHDIAGDSALINGVHQSSVIALSGCQCYAINATNLMAVLKPHTTLTSLLSYVHYTSLLRSRHAVVRDRYSSSYTSAVNFRLFVDGSLRRNLSHRNERRKLIREAIAGGSGHSSVSSMDPCASAQIRHTQKFERRAKRAKAAAEQRRYGITNINVNELNESSDEEELAAVALLKETRIRRRSTILSAPIFLSFTSSLPLLDPAVMNSTSADTSPAMTATRLELPKIRDVSKELPRPDPRFPQLKTQ